MLQPCVEHDVPLTHVARQQGIPLRTLQRWLAQYRRDGLAGLARRRRRDRGQPHGLPPELTQIIEGLALRKPPPTVALVHRQVREVARHNGWPVPNYHRVYRIVKQLDPALRHPGPRGQQNVPYHVRSALPTRSRNSPTTSGRPIIPCWISGCATAMDRPCAPGSPSSWMITAGPLPVSESAWRLRRPSRRP